jgi:uncharacterized protein (DUF2461 family)
MTFFTPDFLKFFIELAPNNNKDWFDINRKRYEQSVKEPFRKFVQHIIDELAKTDKTFKDLEAKDCFSESIVTSVFPRIRHPIK